VYLAVKVPSKLMKGMDLNARLLISLEVRKSCMQRKKGF
jgi:hypothetical protein